MNLGNLSHICDTSAMEGDAGGADGDVHFNFVITSSSTNCCTACTRSTCVGYPLTPCAQVVLLGWCWLALRELLPGVVLMVQ
jgi:hypothetical protein